MPNTRIISSLYMKCADLDPAELSVQIGLQATSSGIKGTPREGKRPPVPESFWCYEIECIDCGNLNASLTKLMDAIYPYIERIQVCMCHHKQLQGYFLSSATFFSLEERPLYEIDHNTLRQMSEFGFPFSLDVYDYSD